MQNVFDWLPFVVKCTAILSAAYLCLPYLLQALGLSFYRSRVRGGPGDLYPDASDPVYADLYEQLTALRFSPMGIHWEKALGCPSGDTQVFRSRDGRILADVSRICGSHPTVAFRTVFEQGGSLLTGNYDRPRVEEEYYLAQGLPNNCLPDVLAEHERSMERFAAAGHVAYSVTTLEEAESAHHMHFGHPVSRRFIRREFFSVFLMTSAFIGVIPSILWAILASAGQPDSAIPWLALLGLCGLLAVLIRRGLRAAEKQTITSQSEASGEASAEHTTEREADRQRARTEFRNERDKVMERWTVRMARKMADRLADLFLARPWAFDVGRGWLHRGHKTDFVMTIHCGGPAQPWLDKPPCWRWMPGCARRFHTRLTLLAVLSQSLAAVPKVAAHLLVLATLAACTHGIGQIPLNGIGGRLAVTMLFIMGATLALVGLVTLYTMPTLIAALSNQRGELRKDLNGDWVVEFHYPRRSVDDRTAPVRSIVPVCEHGPDSYVAHGTARFWYVNGRPAAEMSFLDGLPHGPVTTWHLNGQTKSAGLWTDGMKAETWQYWDERGSVHAAACGDYDTLFGCDGVPHDAASELRSHHWSIPLLVDPNVPPKELRDALTQKFQLPWVWWSRPVFHGEVQPVRTTKDV